MSERARMIAIPVRSPTGAAKRNGGSGGGDHADEVAEFRARRATDLMHAEAESSDRKELRKMEHLAFEKISSIQFCVDGAVGLPMNSSATRVTTRLYAHDRSNVGEAAPATFSDPETDFTSPSYDLHMSWRGSSLRPSLTIICRIDTLERPALRAKFVGFAVLKLFVDEEGEQPLPDHNSSVCLNAGQYLLPIVYGRVPREGLLNEALMEQLPHIHGCYLRVRLFDPSVETIDEVTDHSFNNMTIRQMRGGSTNQPHDSSEGFLLSPTSITMTLMNALPHAEVKHNKLQISAAVAEDIRTGQRINDVERRILLKQVIEWIANAFPPPAERISGLEPRFMVPYDDRSGALVALDMLLNMPDRKRTLVAVSSEESAYYARVGWNGRIVLFKTVFRYLPGTSKAARELKRQMSRMNSSVSMGSQGGSSTGGGGEDGEERVTDWIVDDASIDLNMTSYESFPSYSDDFSSTAELELSPNACLLIVTTAVDVLTNSESVQYTDFDIYRANNNGGTASAGGLSPGSAKPKGGKSSGVSKNGVTGKYKSGAAAISPVGSSGGRDKYGQEITYMDGDMSTQASSGYGGGTRGYAGSKVDDETAFKLRGLVGINIAHNSPSGTFWGILPLMGQCPFPVDALPESYLRQLATDAGRGGGEAPDTVMSFDSVDDISNKKGGMAQKNLRNGANSGNPGIGNGILNSVNIVSAGGTHSPVGNPTAAAGSESREAFMRRHAKNLCFVNSGTHQVPLFEGIPPREMIRARNPMGWLERQLRSQQDTSISKAGASGKYASKKRGGAKGRGSRSTERGSSCGSCFCGGNSSSTGAVIFGGGGGGGVGAGGSSSSSRELFLSNGSSAVIRVIDSRLRKFGNDSITQRYSNSAPETAFSASITTNPVEVNIDLLSRVLRAYCTRARQQQQQHQYHNVGSSGAGKPVFSEQFDERSYRKWMNLFLFQPVNVKPKLRTVLSAIPNNIYHDALIRELNQKFTETVSSVSYR